MWVEKAKESPKSPTNKFIEKESDSHLSNTKCQACKNSVHGSYI